MKLKLSDQTIAGLTLPDGKTEDFAWDAALTGFGLRLRRRRDGRLLRTWTAQFRVDGRTRRVTIGDAERLTSAQAREAARKLLARASLGHDPQAERETKRAQAALTFRSVAETYLEAKRPELRPASFRVSKLYLLGSSYFGALHPIGVSSITRADIAARLTAITRGHSANTSAAARRQIAALFRWAMEEGFVQSNPVIGTRQPARPIERDRVLADAELTAIWNASGDDDFGRITRLLILLGSRRQEVGGMRWSEFDLDAGTWALPGARAKNRRGHAITMPPAALAIIKSVPQHAGRDHLFGETAGAGFMSWARGKVALDQRLGDTVKPWRVHDIRRSVATGMADIGIEPHVVEAVLSHYSGHRAGTAGIYNRSPYERAVKTALARWSEHVLALVEGRASKVVPLRTA
jgi:integrase